VGRYNRPANRVVDDPAPGGVWFAKLTLRDMNDDLISTASAPPLPTDPMTDLASQIGEAVSAWLTRSPSAETRSGYTRELNQFLRFAEIPAGARGEMARVRPADVSAWRDRLFAAGLTNTAVGRKFSVLRSLFGYLRAYGYAGPNPADTWYVAAPPVPRDGKTVGLTPEDCRRLLDAPPADTPEGVRGRALLAVLAYTGCRVGEVCRFRVEDYKASGGHKVLEVRGKGGRERRVPLHPEAIERIDAWLETAGLRDGIGALFRPGATARGRGRDSFKVQPLTRRAVQYLVARYVRRLGLDPNVTVHSFRVTALTTARERGADIVDLQDFAGHADPRTTLGYIHNRDRLSRSPAYVLKY
jgi:integrase/recombinase XerD